MLIFPFIEDRFVFFNWRSLSARGVTIISARLIFSSCRESLSILIENLHKHMFTNNPFRLIRLPNNRLLEEQQFFVYSHIFLIIFLKTLKIFLSKMSALNKTESQIWRQYMNLSLHSLSLSPNRHYDHVLFSRLSLWVMMRYKFDTWKGSFRVC